MTQARFLSRFLRPLGILFDKVKVVKVSAFTGEEAGTSL